MAFTEHSELFGAAHEDGFNAVIRHVRRLRPSLFNYATALFQQRPDLFCAKIEAAPAVLEAGNPLFTEQAPLPVLGAPIPLGLNFCLQLAEAQIDFHPGGVFGLPPGWWPLPEQHFALRVMACAGVGCPPPEVLDELVPALERATIARQQLALGETKENGTEALPGQRAAAAGARGQATAGRLAPVRGFAGGLLEVITQPSREMLVLTTRELTCFCLEVFVRGHFEWGPVPGSQQQWLKPRVDAIEIVDLKPTEMENAIECYLMALLRLGVLPRLIVPMEKMVLDITALLRKQGLAVGQQVSLGPAEVPGDVPNNPAVEEDQIKAFIKLAITNGGA